jgi:hypothetical protein
MIEIAPAQIEQYRTDGFLILERFLSPGDVARARERFEPIFHGEFETGLYPDEWNRQPDDYHEALKAAAQSVGARIEIVPIEVPAGTCVIHAGRTWHGSNTNRSLEPRRTLVTHSLPVGGGSIPSARGELHLQSLPARGR